MPVLIAPWLAAAIPGAVTGLASIIGGERRNVAQANQAQKAMAFSERMRNTEWQAAVADMRAAGINPAVAYQQGGAASPQGVQAPMEDTLGPGVSSAMQATRMRRELELLKEQANEVRARTVKEKAEGDIKTIERRFQDARWAYYFNKDGTPREALRNLLQERHSGEMASNSRQMWESELAALSIPERRAMAKLFDNMAGSGAKGAQLFMPLLIQMLRGR